MMARQRASRWPRNEVQTLVNLQSGRPGLGPAPTTNCLAAKNTKSKVPDLTICSLKTAVFHRQHDEQTPKSNPKMSGSKTLHVLDEVGLFDLKQQADEIKPRSHPLIPLPTRLSNHRQHVLRHRIERRHGLRICLERSLRHNQIRKLC